MKSNLRKEIERILSIKYLPDGVVLYEWQTDQILKAFRGVVPEEWDLSLLENRSTRHMARGYNQCREEILKALEGGE